MVVVEVGKPALEVDGPAPGEAVDECGSEGTIAGRYTGPSQACPPRLLGAIAGTAGCISPVRARDNCICFRITARIAGLILDKLVAVRNGEVSKGGKELVC